MIGLHECLICLKEIVGPTEITGMVCCGVVFCRACGMELVIRVLDRDQQRLSPPDKRCVHCRADNDGGERESFVENLVLPHAMEGKP